MVSPTPALASFVIAAVPGESGRMKEEAGDERLQKADTIRPWPPPTNFIWRFRGGRSNDPTSENPTGSQDSQEMAVGPPVLWNLSDSWRLPRHGDGEQANGGGCCGCNKILRDEGRILEAESFEPPAVVPVVASSECESSRQLPFLLSSSPTPFFFGSLARLRRCPLPIPESRVPIAFPIAVEFHL